MRRVIGVLRAAAIRFSQDACGFFAQAIAFNAMFAVFPLLILAFAVMGFIYGNQGAVYVNGLVERLAPSIQGPLIANAEHVIHFRGIAGAIAIVALLWSGKNLFQTLAFSLDRALGIPKGRHPLGQILIEAITFPVFTLILLAATAFPIVVSIVVRLGGFRHAEFWSQVASYGAGLLVVFVVTMWLYTFLPNRRFSLRFGIPGAIVTTVLWEISQIAFAVYSTHVDFTHVYGALGAVAILLLWFYYMGTIFLFGAQVSAQWLAWSAAESAKATPVADPVRQTA
jgi:membrane protein